MDLSGSPLGMMDPMIMASLGSLMNTLQGSNVQSPTAGLDQAGAAQAQAQAKAASDAADQASQKYQQMSAQPMPQVPGASQGIQSLLGNTASVLGGNPQYAQNAQQRIQQQHMDLLQTRAQQLQAAKDEFDRKTMAATMLGRYDIAGEYKEETARITQAYQGVLKNMGQVQDTIDKLKIGQQAHENKLGEIAEAGKWKQLAGGQEVQNAHDFAQKLIDGTLSPDLMSGRPTKQTLQVATEMQKIDPNWNQQQAKLDLKAKERFIATLNGRQQVQIRQSVDTIIPGFDKLDDLNRQLTALIPRSNAKALDQISVGAAKDWAAYGPQAQAISTQLRALTTSLVPELANVYQAGGIPTDAAMTLAEQTIDPKATPNQLISQIKLARQNLSWKMGAIKNVLPLNDRGEPISRVGSNESSTAQLNASNKLRLKYMAEDSNQTGFIQLLKDNPELRTDPDVVGYALKLKGGK